MRARGVFKGLAGAVALLLMYPFAAYADGVTADGDVVNANRSDVVLTGACVLPSVEVAGQVEVKRNGSVHFDAGQTVRVTYSASHPQIRVDGPETIQLPSDYTSNGTSRYSFDIKTQVLGGVSQGSGSVTVTVSRSGYSESDKYKVDWNCAANSAPNVTIGGVENGATYDFGQVPAATCFVSDREDGSKSFAAALTGPSAGSGLGEQTALCEYTDNGGLKAAVSATYTIADLSPPVMPELPDVTAEATGPDGADVTFSLPDASDAVDGNVPLNCVPAAGKFALGATPVNCTATDVARNQASGSFSIHVVDTTVPALELPESLTIEATSEAGATHTYTPAATDLVDGDVPVTCNPASGSTFALGVTEVTCTAADAEGNEASGSFAVTVQDTTGPKVTVPADVTIEATGSGGATHTFTASAHDAVDGDLTPECTPAPGSTFTLGSTTVQCSATDSRGNGNEAGFTVTVVDTTAPELILPDNITAEATGSNGAIVDFKVTATDLVDESVMPVCDLESGGVFPLGESVVNCTATDAAGNAGTGSFTVTVRDTTAPEMPTYADLAGIEATGPDGATVTFDAGLATDLVSGPVPVTCVPTSGSVFPLGTTPVECTATDRAGNTGEAEFRVTVVDTTAPALEGMPDNHTIEATGPLTQIKYGDVTATDIVDGSIVATCAPASATEHPLGQVKVTCSAKDKSGNGASESFLVTIQDTTKPVIPEMPNLKVEATSAAGAVVGFGPFTATDSVDGPVPVTCDRESGSVFPLGGAKVTCTATDSSGNTGTNEFTVTVHDTTKPTLTVPDAIKVQATSGSGAVVPFEVTAVDAVTENLTVQCSVGDQPVSSSSVFPIGTTTVKCSATDDAGNIGQATFTVSVSVGWGGFVQPLNPGGPATFKLNSTIPVKFQLAGASAGISDLDARLYARKLPGGAEFAAVSTSKATTGNAFRWDADGGFYIFNLNTKALQGPGMYELSVDLGDDVEHTIQVEIRK